MEWEQEFNKNQFEPKLEAYVRKFSFCIKLIHLDIRIQTNGNKKVTILQGLENKFNHDKLLKTWRKVD
jgi:hypothetical protein